MTERVETVVLGGGVAGLSCARKLAAEGREVMLLTDRLGGRMHVSRAGMNLGAAYVTPDYRHVGAFVDQAERIYLHDCRFWDRDRFITVYDPHNLVCRAKSLARLYAWVIHFRHRLNRMRDRCVHMCQREAMLADPLLRELVEMNAVDFVRREGLEELTEVFCGPLFASTLFVDWYDANAFYYLANLFVIVLPTFTADFANTAQRMVRGIEDRVVMERVVAVDEGRAGWEVRSETGRTVAATNLVVAAPTRNVDGLVDVPNTSRNIPFCTVIARGTRRESYHPGAVVFLRAEDHAIRCLWPQRDGSDIIYSPTAAPDLSQYYSDYVIEEAVQWKTAVQLADAKWRPLNPRDRLFTIGDHNICGLEDSFLTGVFAANRIAG